ncbi:hypothetical protein D3C73_1282760 [compost metagenome]
MHHAAPVKDGLDQIFVDKRFLMQRLLRHGDMGYAAGRLDPDAACPVAGQTGNIIIAAVKIARTGHILDNVLSIIRFEIDTLQPVLRSDPIHSILIENNARHVSSDRLRQKL